MKTKYDIGDKVTLKAVIHGIAIVEKGVLYQLTIDGETITVKESVLARENDEGADIPRGTYTNSEGDVEWYATEATCNLCGERWMGARNFCPNCGADMKGADDEKGY